MNKEINTIIANLEGCIGMFDYLLTPTESNLLVAYIEELQQENKQLKDNWNMLKEHLTNRYNNGTESISYRQVFIEIREAMQVLEIAQELEQGSDSNDSN